MAFGKKKKTKQPKSKEKGSGFLDKMGVKTEEIKSTSQVQNEEEARKIKQAWAYVRDRVDASVIHYYRTGDFSKLEEFMGRPAVDAAKAHLDSLRSKKVFLEHPNNRMQHKPKLDVIDVKRSGDKPVEFTIRETWNDHTVLKHAIGPDPADWTILGSAEGKHRVIEATVAVIDGREYKIKTIRRAEEF